MGIKRVVENTTFDLREMFVDDFDEPLEVSNQSAGPKVMLLDTDKAIIFETVAVADLTEEAGTWRASITIPPLDLTEAKELKVVWSFVDAGGTKHRLDSYIVVEPAQASRHSHIILLETDTKFELLLPFAIDPAQDTLTFSLYRNNKLVYPQPLDPTDSATGIVANYGLEQSTFQIPANGCAPASMEAVSFIVRFTRHGSIERTLDFNLWCITPQILVATSLLEDYINKARLENIIPELEYTKADLVQYLQRGLGLFNTLAPYPTQFTGTNMRGGLLDNWLVCASYYALSSQLQAEGAMAFDFSGQTVNLNVDRTPSIEAALGRIENQIENMVKPYKKLLNKAGLTGGTGKEGGDNISTANSFGTLQVLNAPTTRLPGTTYNGFRGSRRY